MSLLPANSSSVEGSTYNYYSAPQKWIFCPLNPYTPITAGAPVIATVPTDHPMPPGIYIISVTMAIQSTGAGSGTANGDTCIMSVNSAEVNGYSTVQNTVACGLSTGGPIFQTITGLMQVASTISTLSLSIFIGGTRTYTVGWGSEALTDGPAGIMIQPLTPFTQDITGV